MKLFIKSGEYISSEVMAQLAIKDITHRHKHLDHSNDKYTYKNISKTTDHFKDEYLIIIIILNEYNM